MIKGRCAGGCASSVDKSELRDFIETHPDGKYQYSQDVWDAKDKRSTEVRASTYTITEFKCVLCGDTIQVPHV
jgi:hypothetical protein